MTDDDKKLLTKYITPLRLVHGFHLYPVKYLPERDKLLYVIANTSFWLTPKKCYKKDVERLVKHLALHFDISEIEVMLRLGSVGHRGYDGEYRGPQDMKGKK